MISIKHKGNFKHVEALLSQGKNIDYRRILEKYGKEGVASLSSATPTDSGKTASSWSYSIEVNKGLSKVIWNNSNIENGANIAILLQYGHATGNGGYVQGQDYINPALRSVIEKLAEEAWKEVTKV